MALPVEEFRDQLVAKLKQRGVRFECELCSQDDWELVEQPIPLPVVAIGARAHIPSVALICNNCGNMRLLALDALGLAPTRPATRQKETA